MPEMITETIDDSDVVGGTNRIVDLIAELTAKLSMIPEEFRDSATLRIEAYDWECSYIEYERPMTPEEIEARSAEIEAQRQRAAKEADTLQFETWLRNIRISGIPDRDEAMEFLRTNPEANQYHPDVWPPVKKHPAGWRPWATQTTD